MPHRGNKELDKYPVGLWGVRGGGGGGMGPLDINNYIFLQTMSYLSFVYSFTYLNTFT